MRLGLAVCLGALLLAGCGDSNRPGPAPVVWIVVDTLRADHASGLSPEIRTPSIDELARDGVRFPKTFSHAPLTLPSHVAMFSSRHVFTSGVKLNAQVLPELPMLSTWFARAGYRTAAVVSLSSLWPIAAGLGMERGFETYVYDGNVDCWPAERVHQELEGVLDGWADGQEPFFLFAHFSDPHDPYNAHGTVERFVDLLLDERLVERVRTSEFGFRQGMVTVPPGEHRLEFRGEHAFKVRLLEVRGPEGLLPTTWQTGKLWQDGKQAVVTITNPTDQDLECDLLALVGDSLSSEETKSRYRLEVEHVDRYVGEFLASLRRRGLYDQALILLTADHGEALGEHGHVGHVVNLHDEMLHVPLVIKLPRGHAKTAQLASNSERLVRLIDLAPTVLDALDLPGLPGQQGSSLLGSAPAQALLAETYRPLAPKTQFALRDPRFKLMYFPADHVYRLFDVLQDPGELADVFQSKAGDFIVWQQELARTAAASAAAKTAEPVLDPKAARRLQGLGY